MKKNFYEYLLNLYKINTQRNDDEILDAYPSGESEITILLKNGQRERFDIVRQVPILCRSDGIYDETEESWRKYFADKLNIKMSIRGVSVDSLALMTNISSITIYKYLNGSSTPSGYNMTKIARALESSLQEFIN